ncbi:MAG: histidinol-phosphate transaminase [Candidatus Omnitrophota bacterium]
MEFPFKKSLARIIPYQPGKPIDEVKRELALERVIKLASNENPFGPSDKVKQAIAKASLDVNRYPDGGCFYLRKALSEKLSVSAENIVFGNGSDELIVLALRAFVEKGQEVIMSDPTFLVYKIASAIAEAQVISVPVKLFKYDLKKMLEAITPRTRMIFIVNPENPTGTYLSGRELEEFIEKVPSHVVVFMDEAYYEFARGGGYPESLSFTARKDRNVIVSRTFSKAYGLAGLRIGYVVAGKGLCDELNKVREPFNVNSVAQAAAIAALEDEAGLERSLGLVLAEKEKLCGAFKEMDVEFVPSETNFILVNTKRDSKKIFKVLLGKGIIVREMSSWSLRGFIRVSVGLPEENDIFIEEFRKAVASMSPEITGQ